MHRRNINTTYDKMKSIISYLYEKIVVFSPWTEILFRKLYWKNVSRLKKYKPKANTSVNTQKVTTVDFTDVIHYLKDNNIGDGSLLIIHSSYDALACTGLSPEEIIEQLLHLVGKNGTLAMPVIRKFKGEPKYENILTTDTNDLVCTYNVQKTVIISGMLPYTLMQHEGSVTSRFPLNPMTAVGSLASDMMQHNLEGEYPSPHGIHSSWKFCLDHGAIVVGLGVDLSHYLTITHVAEEAFPNWPVSREDWYRKRIFDIKDGDYQIQKTVLERKPKWGMLYYMEKRLKRDILKQNILQTREINGITVSIVDSQKYISFLNSKNSSGYPYYIR